MTDPVVSTVVKSGVAGHQPMHPAPQIGPAGLWQKMIVIAHEHEGVQLHRITLKGLRHQLEKTSAIIVSGKNTLPLVPPASEVIERPFIFDSQGPRHSFAYRNAQSSVKEFRFDPHHARFEALRKALPSQFSAGSANREKYCFKIT